MGLDQRLYIKVSLEHYLDNKGITVSFSGDNEKTKLLNKIKPESIKSVNIELAYFRNQYELDSYFDNIMHYDGEIIFERLETLYSTAIEVLKVKNDKEKVSHLFSELGLDEPENFKDTIYLCESLRDELEPIIKNKEVYDNLGWIEYEAY